MRAEDTLSLWERAGVRAKAKAKARAAVRPEPKRKPSSGRSKREPRPTPRPQLRPLTLAALCTALAFTGCIKRTEPVRLENATPVAVAFVQDPEAGGAAVDVPQALKDAVTEALAARNLQAEAVPFHSFEDSFSRVRASERRFEILQQGTRAPVLLLVETKASFFSQITGRYRWVVHAKLTGNRRDATADATVRQLEEPVILVFDHERAPAAITQAAPRIAEQAGTLFDDLLATPVPTGAEGGGVPKGTGPQETREGDVKTPAEPAGGTPTSPQGALPGRGAIYFVMVDRFANGDPSNDGAVDLSDPAAFHGGDLQGVIDRLDWLQSLGVETVWLSPVFKMRTEKFYGHGAFHGYWVEDFNEIEPRFGDRRLLRRLSDELHQRGMKLLLDVVLNHVGPETRLAREKPEWFHRRGPLENWDDPVQLVSHDVHGLPDFAQEKPEVYRYLLDASLKWIREVKPDGFRLDAVKHMPLAFWKRYTDDVRREAGDGFLLLGEMLDGDPLTLARTQKEGGFNALFDFPLHFAVNDVFCRGEAPSKLGAVLTNDRIYADPFALVTLVDNHDLPRVISTCGGDVERVKQALLFTIMARGTPSLTWGTEVALPGAKEPENRASMQFVEQHELREFIARALEVRAKHPSLRSGVPMIWAVGPEHLVLARVERDEMVFLGVNRGSEPLVIRTAGAPQGATWRDAMSGEVVAENALIVRAKGVRVFVAPVDAERLRLAASAEWRPARNAKNVVRLDLRAVRFRSEMVHIVGSAPELGSWDPFSAPSANAKGFYEVRLPPGVYEYKLVLVDHPHSRTVWEQSANRVLHIRRDDMLTQYAIEWERPERRVMVVNEDAPSLPTRP